MAHALAETAGQLGDAFFCGEVGCDRVAVPQGAEFIGGLLAGLGVARADKHRRSCLDEGLGDHFADTTGAAGHQSGAALQGEVGVHGES